MLDEILFLKIMLALISSVFTMLIIAVYVFAKKVNELERKFYALCDYLNILIEFKSFYDVEKLKK